MKWLKPLTITKQNITKSEIYYLSIILMILKIYYSTSEIFKVPNILSKLITISIIGLLIIKICMEKYSTAQKIGIFFILICTTITSYITGEYLILLTALMAIGIKNVDIKKVLKIIIFFNIFMLVIHSIIYFWFLIFNKDVMSFHYTKDQIPKYDLFLGNPNYASLIILVTYMAYMYLLYYNKKNKIKYIVGIALIVFIGFTTKSRTTMILISLVIVLHLISNLHIKAKLKIFQLTSKFIFIVFSILIISFLYISKDYTNVDKKIDEVISGRIWYMKRAKNEDGMSLIGQKIQFKEKYLILDNLYARIYSNYGIIYFVILSYLFVRNNKKMKINDQIIMILFAVYGLTEYLIINTVISVPLLILSNCIFNRGKQYGKDRTKIGNCNSSSV